MLVDMDIKNHELISQGAYFTVYRAEIPQLGGWVILKKPRINDWVSNLSRLKNEYTIRQSLNVEGVPRVLQLIESKEHHVLISEDVAAQTLQELIGAGSFNNIKYFLSVTIQIVTVLNTIHAKKIIHNNINPLNILVQNDHVHIIGFSAAQNTHIKSDTVPIALDQNLSYLSPEQTGRMNRKLDYRSDFYSLGICFYEMLTGHVPFVAQDPIELIHKHLSQQPLFTEASVHISPVVCNLVLKLLDKNPDKRYQSCFGILDDLKKCSQSIADVGYVKHFNIGLADRLGTIKNIENLYGRQHELIQLKTILCGTGLENKGLVLVKGGAGVGKTALLNEFYKLNCSNIGFYAVGRCEKPKRNVPYYSLLSALEQIVAQMLVLPEEQHQQWSLQLKSALGSGAGSLVQHFPHLMRILDVELKTYKKHVNEPDSVFINALLEFVSCLTQHQHPCVLVFDDLQWVDSASAEFIHLLMRQTHVKNILVVCLCRDIDADYTHSISIMQSLTTEFEQKCLFSRIQLGSLDRSATRLLLHEMLGSDAHYLSVLADLVFQKTTGNPFYIQYFVKHMYDETVLFFNEELNNWVWDECAASSMDMVGNIEAIMQTKLLQLNPEHKKLLNFISCYGASFEFDDIAKVLGEEGNLKYSFIALVNTGVIELDDKKSGEFVYKIFHEKAQQDIYEAIDFEERCHIHISIARANFKESFDWSVLDALYFIVDHFNLGLPLLNDKVERYVVARLNVVAGNRTKSAGSYSLALNYYKRAIALVDSDHWVTHEKFMKSLCVQSIETAYYCHEIKLVDLLESHYKQMVSHYLEQLPLIEFKVHYYLSVGQYKSAILLGRDTLKKLGLSFSVPRTSELSSIYNEMCHLVNHQMTLPVSIKPKVEMTHLDDRLIRVLVSQIEPALVLNKEYFCQIILHATGMVLNAKHPLTGYILAYFSLMQAYVFKDVGGSIATSEYALRAQCEFSEPEYLPRALNAVNAHVRHFWQPLTNSLAGFDRAIVLAMESGDIYYTGQSIIFALFAQFFSGQPLLKMSDFMNRNIARLSDYGIISCRDAIFPWCQIIVNLQNTNEIYLNSTHVVHLKGRYFNDRLMFQLKKSENEFMIFSAYVAKAWYSFCLKDIDCALSALSKAEEYSSQMHGMMHFHIFYSLAGQVYASAARRYEHQCDYYLSKAKIYLDLIESLATQNPDNYLHKLYAVKAEIAYAEEHHLIAMKYFEKSLRQAISVEFTQDAAMIAEQAAFYCMNNNITGAARGYLMTALEQYKQWGASLKVFTLSRDYAKILLPFDYSVFSPNLPVNGDKKTTPFLPQNLMSSSSTKDDPIDYLSAIRVSHLISQELDPKRLLSTIIELISINAGADRGILFQIHGDELKTAASFPKFDHYEFSSNHDDMSCMSVVNYVKRLRKPVVVDDAMIDAQYFGDAYVKRNKIRSILCTPFMYQSRLLGVIYLENNQSSHVFNTERLAFLQLVVKQSAISFENAKYYDAVLSAEEAMQEQKSLLESILNSISEGVVVIDENKKVIHYNHMAQALLGIDSSDLHMNEWPSYYGLYNMDKVSYFPMDEFPTLRALNGETFANVKMHVRNQLNTAGKDILVSGCPLMSIDGKYRRGGVISLRDMSEFNRNLEQIQHLATHDELTNLPNRNLFYDRVAQAVLMAGQYNNIGAVLFLDLDNFKEVNDTLGHSVGDILLQEIAHRLENHIKECDTVARLGGDEFGMLLDKLDSFSDASKVARRIIDSIAQPIIIDGQLIQTSVSIGVTVFPVDGINTEQLLKNADLAMYSAKSQGRNTFCFFADHMNDKVLLKNKLGQELRKALEVSQFEMYYQPQVNPVTHELIGFESLIRWPDHPEHNAEQFISIAEEIGIIHLIGEWIIREVCHQIQLWKNTDLNVPIAVNISALQFRQSSFIAMVQKILTETGVSPALLEFELTESAVFHFKDGIAKMQQLKEMGIHISLDDFGTGYSSLSHLKRLPVQKIKIDRSFIHDVDLNEDSCNIAHAIITLGHCLELVVVAEGVENREQLQLLRGLECDIIQGHYFSKPLSADNAESWLSRFKNASKLASS